MNLYVLCYFGLLTEHTTQVLKALDTQKDWKVAAEVLVSSGLVTSLAHAKRMVLEIKKRLAQEREDLPPLRALIDLAKSRLNSAVKAQVYFTYLVNFDAYVAKLVKLLGDVYYGNMKEPTIEREQIKQLFTNYLKSIDGTSDSVIINRWLEKFIAVMREAGILIQKDKTRYILGFNNILPETWVFFTLHAWHDQIPLRETGFFKAFQVRDPIIPLLLERTKHVKFISYKMRNPEKEITDIEISPGNTTITEWLAMVA